MERAIGLIKEFESLRLSSYRCPAGVWTIGWGHTEGVGPGMRITEAEAGRLLRADVEKIGRALDATGVELTATQRQALVSFAFNVGVGTLLGSTLWRLVCRDARDRRIADEFGRWKYAGGRVMNGLIRRRAAEAALYFSEEE